LGEHHGDNTRTGSYIENFLASVGRDPGSEQYCIGANFHGTLILLYGKLFEGKTGIGHKPFLIPYD
jgi:hypothetical protein